MNAMILAAGRGTRLGELGRTVPKVLVDIGGEPLLRRQIRYLEAGCIENIVVNAHHLAAQIEDFVANHPSQANLQVVVEPQLLGTAGGVRNALALLGDDAFAVLYGDVVVDEPLGLLCETHRRTRAAATLALYQTTEIDGKGTVEIGPDGLVSAFHEKARTSLAAGTVAYVNAGLYIIDPCLMRDLPQGVELDFGHDVFPSALNHGQRLAGHVLNAPVIDVGTPAMLELACREQRLGRPANVGAEPPHTGRSIIT
jgi:NDP-sugar pyrophosphorylase family protein